MMAKLFIPTVFVLLTGCAMLQPQKAAMNSSSKQIAAAELRVKAARDAGAASYAAKNLKMAEADLQTAKSNQTKKVYDLALTLAKSAESFANEAVRKTEEAKRKEADSKSKAKKK